MKLTRCVQLILAIVSLSSGQASLAAGLIKGDAVRLLDTFKSSTPAEDRAVSVHKFEVDMGPGTLVLEDGVLVPAMPVDGRTLELAFVGDGWFRFSTTDAVEYHQLEIFTGEKALLTPVSQVVLVTGNEKLFESLLHGKPASGDKVREAAKVLKGWAGGPERQGFGADLAMLKAMMGDPRYQGYFAVWCRSQEHGDFYYIVDPSEAEPVTLGQFVPMDLSRLDVWQQRWIKSSMRLYRWFGRFAEFNPEHPGQWDTWASTTMQGSTASMDATPGGPEPEHYTIDLYTNPQIDLDAKASTRIRLRAGPVAVRSVDLSLYAGLRVMAVFGPGDKPIDFIRREQGLHVFLAEPAAPGTSFEIRVDYEGDLAATIRYDESFALLDTFAWHPRTGRTDRATYDVTLRRPKKYDVLASGRMIESGEAGGVAWERRTLDLTAHGFTFELGRFDLVHEQVGHVDVTFGFPRETPGQARQPRDRIISTVKRSLPHFEARLGPYPLDYLTVAIVDREFSQGMLSMVTLAEDVVRGLPEARPEHLQEWAAERRDLTIAHEVSHQWWGNWVGWASYRDQWLSEALASYSALQFGVESAQNKAAFLGRNAQDWRFSLTSLAAEGRTVASLGSVTLGQRLSSSKSTSAYYSIVYGKGSVIFRMLATMLGEEPFARMLGELAKSVANRTIDTETFLKALERMSDRELKTFADQYIYGSDIRDVYFHYTTAPAAEGNGWTIRGEARQVGRGRERLRIVKDTSDAWIVERSRDMTVDAAGPTLTVPFQVVVTPPAQVKVGKVGEVQSARGFGGRLNLKGPTTAFTFNVREKPERLELDQFGEVLATFHDETWTPKRTLRLQAMDLGSAGNPEQAQQLLLDALSAPVYSERAIAWMNPKRLKNLDQAEEGLFEDARIHNLLARLRLDRGDLEGCEREIATAEKLLKEPDRQAGPEERLVLRGRLELGRGNHEAAYQLLRIGLQRWGFSPEGYGLLAVAAAGSGHDRIADQAIERAESRGVDVRALRDARAASAKR